MKAGKVIRQLNENTHDAPAAAAAALAFLYRSLTNYVDWSRICYYFECLLSANI